MGSKVAGAKLQMKFYLVLNGRLHLVRNLLSCCYYVYSNNGTIIKYNNILTCGNRATCFCHFQGGIQQNNTMASYVIGVQLPVSDINVFSFVMEMQQWVPFALLLSYKIF